MSEPVIVAQPVAKPAEKPPEAKVETPDPKLQEQYAKMAAREKTTLAERQKLAEDRRAWEGEKAQAAADKAEAARLRAQFESAKKDPEGHLKSLWGEQWFSHVSELALEKKPPPSMEVAALRDELDQVRGELKSVKQETADDKKARKEREDREAMDRFNSNAIDKVKAAGDKYKLIAALGYHDQVPELIRTHWQDQLKRVEQGNMTSDEMKLLSAEEAAQMVEDHWSEQTKKAAKALDLTAAPVSEQSTKPKAPEGSSRDGTLTNNLTASSAKAPATAPRMSLEDAERERTKRAFAAFDAAKAAQKRP